MKNKKSILAALLLIIMLLTACNAKISSSQEVQPTATPKPVEVKIFEENGWKGLKKGTEVIADAIWTNIQEYESTLGKIYRVNQNGKWGFLNENGEIIIDPTNEWDYYPNSYGNASRYIIAKSPDKKANPYISRLIDLETKKIIFGLKNGNILAVYDDEYVVYTRADEYTGLFIHQLSTDSLFFSDENADAGDVFKANREGPDTLCMFKYYPSMGFKFATSHRYREANKKWDTIDTYYCFLNLDKEMIQSTNFLEVRPEENLIIAKEKISNYESYYTLYNSDLRYITDVDDPDDYYLTEDNHRVIIDRYNWYYDMTDHRRVNIYSPAKIWPFKDGMARMMNSKGEYGYINEKGEVVYDFQFTDAQDFENGKAFVVVDYKKKTIDKNGNIK